MKRVSARSIRSSALCLNSLANLMQATNRLTEAEPYYRRALAGVDEKILGVDHPFVARDLNNLALLLTEMNGLAEAEPRGFDEAGTRRSAADGRGSFEQADRRALGHRA
jgi:hypothetical protein